MSIRLSRKELEYLSAWAREEKAADPYALPAHRLQASHGVRGITLIRIIKAWARAEGRRDVDILDIYLDANPLWPWSSEYEMEEKLGEISWRVDTEA